ncbi:hypothetical protein DL93DRAFT_2091842 [Clavulina sp. PMI_390]|nr:hypothetical protein DL93DRAFT_2091842 [Clavulina sp. PMI_390]
MPSSIALLISGSHDYVQHPRPLNRLERPREALTTYSTATNLPITISFTTTAAHVTPSGSAATFYAFPHRRPLLTSPPPNSLKQPLHSPAAQSSSLIPSPITSHTTVTTHATPPGAMALFSALCTVHDHRQRARRPVASINRHTPLQLN